MESSRKPTWWADNNIPVDLFTEYINRHVKDFVIGLGANVSEATIVNCSKSLKGVRDTCENFDECCSVSPTSMHHTQKSSKLDEDRIIEELTSISRVFAGKTSFFFPMDRAHTSRGECHCFVLLAQRSQKITETHELRKMMLTLNFTQASISDTDAVLCIR